MGKLQIALLIALMVAAVVFVGQLLIFGDEVLESNSLRVVLLLLILGAIGVVSWLLVARRRDNEESSQGDPEVTRSDSQWAQGKKRPSRESQQINQDQPGDRNKTSSEPNHERSETLPALAEKLEAIPEIDEKSESVKREASAPMVSHSTSTDDTIYPSDDLIAGRYEVVGTPMMGGMGSVYKAFDHEVQRPVALKTLKPEYLPDRDARDRLLREGAAWVKLGAHINIVRCYRVEYIENSVEVYLVLELVAKLQNHTDASLRSWLIPGHPLQIETSLLFALQIARGMRHAVEVIPGLVHRDLKPENVLVGADFLPGTTPAQLGSNRIRVTDFGLVNILEQQSTANQPNDNQYFQPNRTQLTHGIVGTPYYMAPEVWHGQPLGTYTDIYALGCIIHEMVSGRLAFSGKDWTSLQLAHCSGAVSPVLEDTPETLRTLIDRCLSVDPTSRYQRWVDVEKEISEVYQIIAGCVPPSEPIDVGLNDDEGADLGWSLLAIGSSYLQLGKTDVSLDYMNRALSIARSKGDYPLEAAAINGLGLANMVLGNSKQAIRYFEDSSSFARKIGSFRQLIQGLLNSGIAHKNLGDFQSAIFLYEQAMELVREIEAPLLEGAILGCLGIAYKNLGMVDRAIKYYQQWIDILRKTGDQRGLQQALTNLGVAYKNLGEFHRAIEYYEEALKLAQAFAYRQSEGPIHANLGVAYENLGEADKAAKHHGKALAISREIGNRRAEGIALGNIGFMHQRQSDFKRAKSYYEQALEIARKVSDRQNEMRQLHNLGAVYMAMGDDQKLIDVYKELPELASQLGDLQREGMYLGDLGALYVQQGEIQRAIPCYHKALFIARETGDRESEERQIHNLEALCVKMYNSANAHLRIGEMQQAIIQLEQALAIARTLGDQSKEGDILGNLGSAYIHLKDFRSAIRYHKQLLPIQRATGNRPGEANTLMNLGSAYMDLSKAHLAVEYYSQASSAYRETGDLHSAATCNYLAASLYAQQGQADRALSLAQEAARIFAQLDSPNLRPTQQLIRQIRGS